MGWAQAQQRVVYTINDGWKFTKGSPFEAQLAGCDDSSWETVNIPHTWNNKDADDETPGFYRGPAWYRKQLFVDKSQEGRQAVIYFEGANQEVRFYLNGQFVGEHKEGIPVSVLTSLPICVMDRKTCLPLCEQCL